MNREGAGGWQSRPGSGCSVSNEVVSAARRRCHLRRESGFTLIELTIGAALMALILTTAYACLSSGVSAREMLSPRWDAMQSARVAMALLGADLRAACPLSKESDFVGMDRTLAGVEADNLDFGTLNHSPRRLGEGDFCQTSYYLEQDQETGELVLWRRRNPRIGVDPFQGGSREEISRGMRLFKLEYYDGFDWYDTWGDAEGNGKRETSMKLQSNLSGLPEAVRITMGFEPGWRPGAASAGGLEEADETSALRRRKTSGGAMTYQTVVRLNGVSTAGGSSTSGGTPGSSPGPGQGEGAPR